MNDKACYCDSGKSFSLCCRPLLTNVDIAQTAVQLMRARFSAFCDGNIDYLIRSHHPNKRQPDDRQQLQQSIDQCQWLQLTIVSSKGGQAIDNKGEVAFIASYRQQGQVQLLRENSQFIKQQGHWYYVAGDPADGDVVNSSSSPIKRNDPCYCGSGKKFKQCCY